MSDYCDDLPQHLRGGFSTVSPTGNVGRHPQDQRLHLTPVYQWRFGGSWIDRKSKTYNTCTQASSSHQTIVPASHPLTYDSDCDLLTKKHSRVIICWGHLTVIFPIIL